MQIAIFDAFSGVAGDMALGALLQLGLEADWLRALPGTLGLPDVGVSIQEVLRGEIVCQKVDFEIPPQPHGRHLREIREIVSRSGAPARVCTLADQVFGALAGAEGAIHGVSPEEVHLHEVGAVDAILDVMGVVWGLERLGVDRVYAGPIALGDGSVRAAHGLLPVPAPATLKLLEGLTVTPGPEGSGELVTPTGAALVRVLSAGPPPQRYMPMRSGFGAGTRDPRGRPNALRIVLAEESTDGAGVEELAELVCDIDDMSPEYLAAAVDRLRDDDVLDAVVVPQIMKRGRLGARVEVLCQLRAATRLEERLLAETTTIGVRRRVVQRRALPRETVRLAVLGHEVDAKLVTMPDGARRAKPDLRAVERVALATGRPVQDIFRLAAAEAERFSES